MQLANQVVNELELAENERVTYRLPVLGKQGKCNSMHIMSSGRIPGTRVRRCNPAFASH